MNNEVITIEAEEVPIEKAVEKSFLTSLEKHEITKEALEEKRDQCFTLKLNGQDKEAYTLIRETRLNQKTNRVVIEKVCKKGREDATKTQKAWLALEKDYVAIVSAGENYLKELEDEFENEQERIKQEAKRKQEEAFIIRQADLTKMGATYQGGSFVLNDVSYEAILIKESDSDVWETMKVKFHEQYLINEEHRLIEEKKKSEAEAELQRQREEQDRKQKELEAREAAIKKAEEAAAIMEQQRLAEESKKANEAFQAKLKDRISRGGYDYNGFTVSYNGLVFGSAEDLVNMPDDVFEEKVLKHNERLASAKKELEERRLAEIEEQKRIAAELAVKKEQERVAEENRKAEEKRLQDEAKKAEELLKATDKTKWQNFIVAINGVSIPDMKHPAYRQKVADAKKFIAKIYDL